MEIKINKKIALPFGKRVACGNYCIMKGTVALSRRDLKILRKKSNIPPEAEKWLQRSTLPYIMVGTVTGSWSIKWMGGLTMYAAIDEIPVTQGPDGKLYYSGDELKNLYNLINFWFCATSTVGDAEFQADVIKAMQRYIDRASKANAEPLPEDESKKAVDEEYEREKHLGDLLKMGKDIKMENDGRKAD